MTNTTITQGSVLTTTTTLDGSIDWTAQYIEPGTRVYCDGQEGRAYPDRRVGSRWDRVTLFVNRQGETGGPNPPPPGDEGLTFAIWGPWGDGAL